jgi:FAD binding domain/Berberine and berberine like
MSGGIGALDTAELGRQFGSRAVAVRSPVQACVADGASAACAAALANLRNPFWIEDLPGGYHTTGWLGAYEPQHSTHAVAVQSAADIAAVVRFARDRGVRLAIKGTGHDYLGRSRSPGSLLVWTHAMREITVHDAFRPAGAPPGERGVPAVTVGAGTRWLEVYQALAPRGRYAQGGGCTTVGAAGGFTQGGGFGHFSKRYGTAAGNVLEAEVVTADGEIVTANAYQHPDLFWALRGGGGGTFGIASTMTFRTHPTPETVSAVAGTIRASSARDYGRLVGALVRLLPDLGEYHWGEQIGLGPDNTVELFMIAPNLTDEQARAIWQPFLDWVGGQPDSYSSDAFIATVPFDRFWDGRWWEEWAPQMICWDERPGQPPGHFWWANNQGEVSWYMEAYQSRWLPVGLFEDSPDTAADALLRASRVWPLQLHASKGLSGASSEVLRRERTTSVNPAAFDAATLVIIASAQQQAYPGVPGHKPDRALGAAHARRVTEAAGFIRDVTPGSGSYVNETDYFEPDWQRSFWGTNYPRLLEIKQLYDPANMFRVHHGVGSEETRP